MAATADTSTPATTAKSGGKLKWVLLILLCSGATSGASWFAAQRNAPAVDASTENPAAATATAQATTPPTFVSLGPSFIVNLAGDDALRFLQVDVQLVTRDAAVATAVQQLEPDLRNRLLLLFSAQHAAELATRNGKEQLQAHALAEIKAGLKHFKAPTDISAVIFTSFVMQ